MATTISAVEKSLATNPNSQILSDCCNRCHSKLAGMKIVKKIQGIFYGGECCERIDVLRKDFPKMNPLELKVKARSLYISIMRLTTVIGQFKPRNSTVPKMLTEKHVKDAVEKFVAEHSKQELRSYLLTNNRVHRVLQDLDIEVVSVTKSK